MQQTIESLKALANEENPKFWTELSLASRLNHDFSALMSLSNLRKKVKLRGLVSESTYTPLKLAVIGACSFYPLKELIEHLLWAHGWEIELFLGEYDNYLSEILEPKSALRAFKPQVVLLIPSAERAQYPGSYLDSLAEQRTAVTACADQLLALAAQLNQQNGAEVLLANFVPPAGFDPGALRNRSLAFEWGFKRAVNLELGLKAPTFVTICDFDFLASRRGLIQSQDRRAWFESKQPGSSDFLVDIAREVVQQVRHLKAAPKKVLVLDLDNTLWGGVIGDLGVEGIEIGDTSGRGQAFKAFQKYVLSLHERGVLLAVCSKNEMVAATAPFKQHPEMVLEMKHFSAFRANWEAKSENIRAMALELNLGLESFVFVDDNPAEIDIVRQFTPEVTSILLGPDPADYIEQLQSARVFEPRMITGEDASRSQIYQAEAERQKLATTFTDMDSYLASLQMVATIKPFEAVDFPRISQLINKSNQFNLTTRRRSESDLFSLKKDPNYLGFSVRLSDKFGEHGLISVFVGLLNQKELHIDTWLMSCRVLKRQVEDLFLNEVIRLAKLHGCTAIIGHYLPTAKNQMVKNLLPDLGFSLIEDRDGSLKFYLAVHEYLPKPIHIKLNRPLNQTATTSETDLTY